MVLPTTSCNCKVTHTFNRVYSTLKEGAISLNQKVQGIWAHRAQLPGADLVSWGSQKVQAGYNNLPSAAQLKDKVFAVFKSILSGVRNCAEDLRARFFPAAKSATVAPSEPRIEGASN